MERTDPERPPRNSSWWTRRWTQARMRAYLRHALAAAQRQRSGRIDIDFHDTVDAHQDTAAAWLREHEATLVPSEAQPPPGIVPNLAILIF